MDRITRLLVIVLLWVLSRSVAVPLAHATGLDSVPTNTTCIAPARPNTNPNLRVTLTTALRGMTWPTAIAQSPVDPNRFYAAQRFGLVQRMAGDVVAGTALDLTGTINIIAEGGLLGIALHPDFANNGYAYLYYTPQANPGFQQRSVVSRFTTLDGGLTFSPATEVVLLDIDHATNQHLGGDLKFGTDGYLYISMGDNTGFVTAQDTSNLLGTILRIDVDSGSPYGIPAGNPFALGGGLPEIFAFGLRNPYRLGIDPLTGDVFTGDVGQGTWEEVNLVTAGSNFGWPITEGSECFEAPTCDTTGLTDPIIEYPHTSGCAVLLAGVYRGSDVPALQGAIIYGDLCSRKVWAAWPDGQGGWNVEELLVASQQFYGFGQDLDGEIYVLDYNQARKIQPDDSPLPPPFPTLLSETGCVDENDPTQPAPGLVPFTVNVPLWSDGAVKERWLALPPGGRLRIFNTGDMGFPIGTVLMKNFIIGGVLGETRLFMRHDDGGWAGYSYEWNAEGTEATLLDDTKTTMIGGQQWTFPSPAQCLQCHTFTAGDTLGPELPQINGDFFYEETGRTANQLTTWEHLGLIENPRPDPPNLLPSFTDMSENEHARAYLHVNCSGCHRTAGGTGIVMDLRWDANTESQTCDVPPTKGNLGIGGARRIKPGDANASILFHRMSILGAGQMPPLGRAVADTQTLALMESWIDNWQTCATGPDSDGDAVPDATDNCVDVPNPGQNDSDANGVGDACQGECSDGIDNDGDGLTDYPDDPGCGNTADSVESPECQDGIDNDGDSLIDSPWDVACRGFRGDTETATCADGIDNDGDGFTDFDGGAWFSGGIPIDAPDPGCGGEPWATSEGSTPGDADGDTHPDATDNCPDDFNFDQSDGDNDGRGDVCDLFPLNPAYQADSDLDGLPDAHELAIGRDPDVPDADAQTIDTDLDGVTDIFEITRNTDPIDPADFPALPVPGLGGLAMLLLASAMLAGGLIGSRRAAG